MIGIRNLGRLGQRALIVAFVAATISCGGPGSTGTVNQDFSTADEFFAGRLSGRSAVGPFQIATWTFTGTTVDSVENGTISVEDDNLPDGVIPPLATGENELLGTFNSRNTAFELFGLVQTRGDDMAMPAIPSVDIGVTITGQAATNFIGTVPVPPAAGVTPGQFTMVIEGVGTFTGTVIRGTFDEN